MSIRLKTLPPWTFLSLITNGILLLTVMLLLLRDYRLPEDGSASANESKQGNHLAHLATELGPRHQLSYDQWLSLLRREALVVAKKQPDHLTILAGDSLSLWFGPDLLPTGRTWLNQGISGETSGGLLHRLQLFDQTQPQTIWVMIGINDLIRGVKDEVILDNQREIIRYLRRNHPQTEIVMQSILPHAGSQATWEGRDRLRSIANSRIRELNRQLAAIADQEGAYYLDLHPLFTDAQGQLRSDLTTDGLHLNPQGYLVWRSAIQVFSQLKLQ